MSGFWQWCCCGGTGNSIYIAWVDSDGQVVLAERESDGSYRYENIDIVSTGYINYVKVILNKSGRPVVFYTDGSINRNIYMSARVGDYGDGYTAPLSIGPTTAYSVAADTLSDDVFVFWRNTTGPEVYVGRISTTLTTLWSSSTVVTTIGSNIVVDGSGNVNLIYDNPSKLVIGVGSTYTAYSMTSYCDGLSYCQGDILSHINSSGVRIVQLSTGGESAVTTSIASTNVYSGVKPYQSDNGDCIVFVYNAGFNYGYVYKYTFATLSWALIASFLLYGGDKYALTYDETTKYAWLANVKSALLSLYSVSPTGTITTELPANAPNYYGNGTILSYACVCSAASTQKGSA